MALPVETARLFLRPFEERDLHRFVAYRSDPAVARYQGWALPYCLEQATTFLKEMQRTRPGEPGRWYQLAIQPRSLGYLVGDCAFCLSAGDAQQAEIGFTLARAHQGQGYATEAVSALLDYLFGTFGLHRVYAVCDVENGGSAGVLERVGMRREAHLIESTWFKGRWSSEYWYAILRAEWTVRREREGHTFVLTP